VKPRDTLSLGLAVLALAGCGGGGGGGGAKKDAAGCTQAALHTHPNGGYSNAHLKLDPSKTYRLAFRTNCGDFTITLDPKVAPNATASLVSLARRGLFKDTFFHRIVPAFIIQGGDPTGTGTGGPGYLTHDKVPANTAYVHGVVAMAKTGADPAGTAGSQFFVVTGQNIGLSPDYAVVGKVTSGLDVVDRIGKLGDASEHPTENVVITNVLVETS
jgi:peptidyl-prolyl cis-trans isomerase B (cyclophilin B)